MEFKYIYLIPVTLFALSIKFLLNLPLWIVAIPIVILVVSIIYKPLSARMSQQGIPQIKIATSKIATWLFLLMVISVSLLIIIFAGLVAHDAIWGEKEKPAIEHLYINDYGNQSVVSFVGGEKFSFLPATKESDIYLGSLNQENFGSKSISFSVSEGEGYSIRVCFVKHNDKDDTDDIFVNDSWSEYIGPSSKTNDKSFQQAVYCPSGVKGSFEIVVSLEKDGWLIIENLKIETWS